MLAKFGVNQNLKFSKKFRKITTNAVRAINVLSERNPVNEVEMVKI